ncbi:WD repeat-containing protein 87, partial [Biomphalaria glabrata]
LDCDDVRLQLLTPWERLLLTKRPIIAPDGYIPNSVVRRRLHFVQPESPKPVWQLKP